MASQGSLLDDTAVTEAARIIQARQDNLNRKAEAEVFHLLSNFNGFQESLMERTSRNELQAIAGVILLHGSRLADLQETALRGVLRAFHAANHVFRTHKLYTRRRRRRLSDRRQDTRPSVVLGSRAK